jgi:ABC-type nitrate/sulfonate/bicarbonate transport system substrate-binding protein
MKRFIAIVLSAVSALGLSTAAVAQTKEVTIGYQDMVVPYRVAQEAKELEKATGYKINWKQFGGGGEVIKAMASGAVQIGEIGSAGIAAAVSRGEPLEVFWILDDIGSAEALVVKKNSGITKWFWFRSLPGFSLDDVIGESSVLRPVTALIADDGVGVSVLGRIYRLHFQGTRIGVISSRVGDVDNIRCCSAQDYPPISDDVRKMFVGLTGDLDAGHVTLSH